MAPGLMHMEDDQKKIPKKSLGVLKIRLEPKISGQLKHSTSIRGEARKRQLRKEDVMVNQMK